MIDVNEPSVEDAVKILTGIKPYYEQHHKVRYTAEAIKAAVELSARYIGDRKLPDKAIDIIDEVGAAQMLLPEGRRKKTIGVKDIEVTISKIARIPTPYPARSSWRAPACAIRRSRSVRTCSRVPPASARPRWHASWPARWA